MKIYQQVNQEDKSLSFGISRMEDIYDKRNGETDSPHRHNYYTVILVKSAKGEHLIDFEKYDLKKNQVFFVNPGQVHQVVEKEKSYGYSIVFSTQFLLESNIPLAFIENLNLFHDHSYNPPLDLNEAQLASLQLFCEQMIETFSSDLNLKTEALGSYLRLFLICCNNICQIDPLEEFTSSSGNSILQRFKKLVDEKYATSHNTSEYAEMLHISSEHLNRTVKKMVGKTAKEFIQARIVVAAKRLFYFSDLSSKEIGYELGFSEPANFSAFIKKNTGKTPTEFIRNH